VTDDDTMEMYIEEAIVALGGDEAPDYLIQHSIAGATDVVCPDCGVVYSVGSIEVWELVADLRKHTDEYHTTQSAIDRLAQERMDDEHG
jgi:hypothetical protein